MANTIVGLAILACPIGTVLEPWLRLRPSRETIAGLIEGAVAGEVGTRGDTWAMQAASWVPSLHCPGHAHPSPRRSSPAASVSRADLNSYGTPSVSLQACPNKTSAALSREVRHRACPVRPFLSEAVSNMSCARKG